MGKRTLSEQHAACNNGNKGVRSITHHEHWICYMIMLLYSLIYCRYYYSIYTRRLQLTRELSLHIKVRHRIVVIPILDLVKVSAYMVTLVVRPVSLLTLLRVEREDIDVRKTHEVHAEDLDAVV